MRLKVCLVAAAVAALALGAFAGGHEEKKKMPEMTAEQKMMMDAWMKSMTPGEAHKLMDGMVGTFDAKVKMWEAPGTEPQVSSGVSESRWILGGRYIESKFKGSMMEMPFEGIGYTGYDNTTQKYWSTWMDSMSTGVMISHGAASADGRTWTWTGTSNDPMGKSMTVNQKVMVKDKDHHTWEMWMPGPDGKQFKTMEIEYTRKGA